MSSEIKAIFFNNGMQAIGKVTEDGDFLNIEDMLQMIIVQTSPDPKDKVATFQHLTPFVDESNTGVTARVHVSAAFTYKVASDLEKAYVESTSRIQLVSAFPSR